MEGFAAFVCIVAVPCLLLMLLLWGNQKRRLGKIRCRRCGHVGEAKGLWRPFRGLVPVCANCNGEDWVTENKGWK